MGKPRPKSVTGRQQKQQSNPFKVKSTGKKQKNNRKRLQNTHTVQTLKSNLELLDEAFLDVHSKVTGSADSKDSITAKVPPTDHSTSTTPPADRSTSRPPPTSCSTSKPPTIGSVEDTLNQTIAHLSDLLPS